MSQLRYYGLVALAGIVAGLTVAVFVLSNKIELRTIERDQARDQVKVEQRAHVQSILNYRKAAAAAQAAGDRNVARVTAEQAAITKRRTNDYQDRLDAVDARYQRVRAALAARTDLRTTGLAPMSIASEATCIAYGGTDCDTLLAKLRIAERQAEQLIGLQGWVRDQSRVIVTPDQ
jgi:hypothetical protein